MKVLNKIEKQRQVECNCGAVLGYTIEDVKTGAFGCAYVVCPECYKEVDIDDDDLNKKITVDNVEFPKDFSNCKDASDVCNVRINGWIKGGAAYA